MKTIPAKVVHEITADEVVTKVFDCDGNEIGMLHHERTGPGSFSRARTDLENMYPEFMEDVDDFHGTGVAGQLDEFRSGSHVDLDDQEEE